MTQYKNKIHDFISLYGAQAYVLYELTLSEDTDYIKYLKHINSDLSKLNPFTVDGLPVLGGGEPVPAEIVHGVWTAVCPSCSSRALIRKESSVWFCLRCWDGESGVFSSIVWRSEWDTVEKILLRRPNIGNRNAYSNESIEDLLQENKDNM